MKIFDANVPKQVVDFFINMLKNHTSLDIANIELYSTCGIRHFFDEDDFDTITKLSLVDFNSMEEPDRAEYGDFQTNTVLSDKVAKHLAARGIAPEIVIEPTCGKGNFIIAALSNFKSIKKIIGIEIYKPYIWETKFSILDYFLSNRDVCKPDIEINHCSIFDFPFKNISKQYPKEKLLIIGNPPWVTNSKLGCLNSSNLPKKSNFKNQNGLDALTGKSNFDIAEFITSMLLEAFHTHEGNLALLVKNSVIKNIVYDQKSKNIRIADIKKYSIDSKKEFNVSVDASLLYCQLNLSPDYQCLEFDFYSLIEKSCFGWVQSKFVSNIADYNETKNIDGVCPFVWRQGIKHDCSSVMELERTNGFFVNNKYEEIILEEDLVYGFLKSSDLKNSVIKTARKHTIVTQSKIGQETSYIKHSYPATYSYLHKNISGFQARKSSIYNGKPLFSIFGIGDYSFKPYKVAISGLYKTYHFSLVLPQNDKPVMLDDTCYFIGFDNIEFAVYAFLLLNSKTTEDFLKSVTFYDAKRVFTKDVLMRIDLYRLAMLFTHDDIKNEIDNFNNKYDFEISMSQWDSFINEISPKKEQSIFE